MGACKIDVTEKGRQYSVRYCLNNSTGIKALLRDRHKIASRRFNGDTDASAILLDLHSAIESAGLTARQAEAIAWVYGKDVTQVEAARIMGITREAVTMFIGGAAGRIAAVYQRWDYGEITVEIDVPEIPELNEEETADFLRIHKGIEVETGDLN